MGSVVVRGGAIGQPASQCMTRVADVAGLARVWHSSASLGPKAGCVCGSHGSHHELWGKSCPGGVHGFASLVKRLGAVTCHP